MQLTFKNTSTHTKGKQCEHFLSILKKLKFLLSSKDRQLSFYVCKYVDYVEKGRRLMITTFAGRNLQNPPAGSTLYLTEIGPLYYIDYQFGQDIYSLSSYQIQHPTMMFSFQIEQTVRLINHYYETKMSIMKLIVESDMDKGRIQFQVPDEAQGYVPLVIQKLQRFPFDKNYINKDHIDYFTLFTLNEKNFQQLRQLQYIKFPCCYQIHDQGIYLKNYNQNIEGNNYLLHKQFLSDYDPVMAKDVLRGNVFVQQAENFLVDEIKVGVKRHYRRMTVKMIVVRRPQCMDVIRSASIQIEANLSLFPKTLKRVITNCELSMQVNTEGFMMQNVQPQNMPLSTNNNNLLKNQQQGLQGLRRVVLNKWVPRTMEYYQDRFQYLREKQLLQEKEEIIQETKTKKIFYKLEE